MNWAIECADNMDLSVFRLLLPSEATRLAIRSPALLMNGRRGRENSLREGALSLNARDLDPEGKPEQGLTPARAG